MQGCGTSKSGNQTSTGSGGASGTGGASAQGPDGGQGGSDGGAPFKQALYAAGEGFLESYDIATGMTKPGVVTNVVGPVDMQALPDGTVMVNLSGRNEILAIDGTTMLEKARIPSSGMGATRPVHSFITPTYDGKTYWVAMNDGTDATDSSARFIDITPGSATYLMAVGEVKLGVGHHKAAFSATQRRAVMSNISDCDSVLSVYDFSDLSNIKTLATLSAKDAGWDGSSFVKTCDPTYKTGVPPAPHGCATSKMSKHVYNSLTGNGAIVDIDIDADTPTFKVLSTNGSGGGHMRASKDGRYLYAVQTSPREGDIMAMPPIPTCQVGQLVVIDAMAGTIAREVPMMYTGPDCATALAAPQTTDGPGDLRVSKDGGWIYVAIDGGFNVADARVDQLVIFDLSDPGNPVQKASVTHGLSTSHVSLVEGGDGKAIFVVDNLAGSTTQVGAASKMVVRAIKTSMPSAFNPLTLATFGSVEGPGQQIGPLP